MLTCMIFFFFLNVNMHDMLKHNNKFLKYICGKHLGSTTGLVLILIKFVCFVINVVSVLIICIYYCKNKICEFE